MREFLVSHTLIKSLVIGGTLVLCACDDETQSAVAGDELGGATRGGEVAGGQGGLQGGSEQGGGEMAGELGGTIAGDMGGELIGGELLPPTPPELSLTGCDPSALNQNASLVSREDRTQIHPSAVWDGEAFWVTWNIANDEGKFETWAGRFGCDLQPIVEPFAVERQAGVNDTDPSIAVDEEVVLIAWSRDDSFLEGEYNLSTRIATLNRDTGERISSPRKLEVHQSEAQDASSALASEGGPLAVGNRWMVNVVTRPMGGFLLSGSWGDPAVNSFRAYLVHLDHQGQVEGSAWLAETGGRDQTFPQLRVSAYGVIDLLWRGRDQSGQEGIFARSWKDSTVSSLRAHLEAGWISADEYRSPQLPYEEGLLADGPLGNNLGTPWVVGTNGGALLVRSSTNVMGGISSRKAISGVQFIPGAILGYQRYEGSAQEIWMRSLSEDGQLGDAVLLTETPNAAAYPLSVSLFKGGALLIWAEGNNPSFKLRGSLISLD